MNQTQSSGRWFPHIFLVLAVFFFGWCGLEANMIRRRSAALPSYAGTVLQRVERIRKVRKGFPKIKRTMAVIWRDGDRDYSRTFVIDTKDFYTAHEEGAAVQLAKQGGGPEDVELVQPTPRLGIAILAGAGLLWLVLGLGAFYVARASRRPERRVWVPVRGLPR